MLSGFLSLKRKLFATEDCDDSADGPNPTCACQRKDPASIYDVQNISASGYHANHGEVAYETLPAEEQEKTVEGLRAKIKGLETTVDVLKKAEQSTATLHKVEEILMCSICHDLIQNPQCLQCGHGACYSCLRAWWTQPPTQDDGAPMVSTDSEPDSNEENAPGEGIAAVGPRFHRRRRFPSAVNRKKCCPCCNQLITCRPSPHFQLQAIAEALDKNPPLPPHIQARREAGLPQRRDIWRGIFHPENERNERYREDWRMLVNPEHELAALDHPDLIQARAQELRAVEDLIARRQRERAFIESWMTGVILETRVQLERAVEVARQTVMARRDGVFWQENPHAAVPDI